MNRLQRVMVLEESSGFGDLRALFSPMKLDESDWQMLIAQVANEKNPKRLIALLDDFIQALDQRRETLREENPANLAIPTEADD